MDALTIYISTCCFKLALLELFPDAILVLTSFGRRFDTALFHDYSHPFIVVQVPCMMIWGTSDQFFGAGELAELTGKQVDDYRVRYIEGASHYVQQDRPEEVNAIIRDFLKE